MLCPGCPHRGVMMALRKCGVYVTGDIGCYTLAALPPLETIDTCLCMGASINHAFGIEKAKKTKKKTVAVIGDSTFLHSGITGLANVVYNRGTQTTIIVDNRITAMTGGQDHPGTSKTLMGEQTHAIDLVELVKALGVEHVRTIDPFDQEETLAVLKEEIAREAPSVVITTKPCVLFPSKLKAGDEVPRHPREVHGVRRLLQDRLPGDQRRRARRTRRGGRNRRSTSSSARAARSASRCAPKRPYRN